MTYLNPPAVKIYLSEILSIRAKSRPKTLHQFLNCADKPNKTSCDK